MTSKDSDISCRLCDGQATRLFSKRVLYKHAVGFYECSTCGSLQTEEPHWIEEAYADSRRFLDTGAVERSERLRMVVYLTTRLIGWSPADKLLDWGGGEGLLTRMLRDVGMDAYQWDKYAINLFAPGFDKGDLQTFRMITAFEVWEHLPHPKDELDYLFAQEPFAHLLTTSLYARQGPDWSYLVPTTGRHVFFYSQQAMELIARQRGYEVYILPGGLSLFLKEPLSLARRRLLRHLLSHPTQMGFLYRLLRKNSLSAADRQRNQAMMDSIGRRLR